MESFKFCQLRDEPTLGHDLNSLLSPSNKSSFHFSITKCDVVHLETVNVGQIFRPRDCVQDGVASGKDFWVTLSNQRTMNSPCKALAMRTHVLRRYIPLGIRK